MKKLNRTTALAGVATLGLGLTGIFTAAGAFADDAVPTDHRATHSAGEVEHGDGTNAGDGSGAVTHDEGSAGDGSGAVAHDEGSAGDGSGAVTHDEGAPNDGA
ncbi:hypothetical protein, partial [Cellulomonas rhizosphaerae]|uniref:hypothetical protein n=1 Tax=Cellulomonas rhizosphaerae TaxID=2293719 RepID=UPI0018F431E8